MNKNHRRTYPGRIQGLVLAQNRCTYLAKPTLKPVLLQSDSYEGRTADRKQYGLCYVQASTTSTQQRSEDLVGVIGKGTRN